MIPKRKPQPRPDLEKLASTNSGRTPETRLELPAGEPDLEALRSVTREWLVPRLVEKFLCKHGVELRASRTAVQSQLSSLSTQKSNTAPLIKEMQTDPLETMPQKPIPDSVPNGVGDEKIRKVGK